MLFGGGKRIRPVLAMMAAEAVGGEAKAAVPWAIAIEMIHNYSLAHDDLPALDLEDYFHILRQYPRSGMRLYRLR